MRLPADGAVLCSFPAFEAVDVGVRRGPAAAKKRFVNMDHENAVKIIKDNFTGKIFNIFSNYGSLLQIDFSEKNTKGDNIFVYMCNWRICHDSIELLTSNDDRTKFDNIFDLLIHDGNEVIDLVFNRENHEFSFYLRNNYSMTIFPNNESVTDDMIIFFIEGRQPICYNIQKGFYSEN